MPTCSLGSTDPSADPPDDLAFGEVLQVWNQAEGVDTGYWLSGVQAEERYLHEQRRRSANQRAKHVARNFEQRLRQNYEDQPDFFGWNPNRALNMTDFDYAFFHRGHFPAQVREWLEIVAAKIIHTNSDGRTGYFNKLERNVGWRGYITPILFAAPAFTDKIVRCGLWANTHNSRRCHRKDFCALCLWNDVLKALYFAFGRRLGAFYRAACWWLITIGWTTNPANAKCAADDFEPEDILPPAGDRGYDPYPVVLGLDDLDPDCPWLGYQDARVLGLAMQEAIDGLYQGNFLDGYHYRLEGEYRLNPGGANRTNLHSHSATNGSVEDGQALLAQARRSLLEAIRKYEPWLSRAYYPDIQVKRITTPEHLEGCVAYTEKVVPVGHMVADAMSRPEAKLPDGRWDEQFISALRVSLLRLIDDDIPALLTGARFDLDLPPLFRRKTVGNMTFTDRGTCIGLEPDWHARSRRKHSAEQLRRRKERKREQAQLVALGLPVPPRRRYRRRNPNPRRLARSLRKPSSQD